MKTSTDSRHQQRINRVQGLFAYTYKTAPTTEIAEILPHLPTLDQELAHAAPEWPLSQMNRVDLAILRQALYELHYHPEVPPKVVVDEAVEIGKAYGAENTPSFVNGVLGTIIRSLKKDE